MAKPGKLGGKLTASVVLKAQGQCSRILGDMCGCQTNICVIHLCPFVEECLSAHSVLFMSSPLTNKLTLEKQESFFPALCSSCWPSLKYAPFSLLLTLPFLLVILSEDRLHCICSMLLLIGPFGPR